MKQLSRLWLPILLFGGSYLLPTASVAGVFPGGLGGGVSIRQETHEDRGDFRFTADLYAAARGGEPYWGYLAVSKELLMVPAAGRALFHLVLVTQDGKPIEEARWTEDTSLCYTQWNWLERVKGQWVLSYPLTGAQGGTRTIYFRGTIAGGKRTYAKLFLVTIGNRKDLRQTDALQFMVYRLPSGYKLTEAQALISAQMAMGAGGKPLVLPEAENQEVEEAKEK
jgi:hypothetical protein